VGVARNAEPRSTARTWRSATFDTDRRLILYWGGGHCGYVGSDVDAYDIESNTFGVAEPSLYLGDIRLVSRGRLSQAIHSPAIGVVESVKD
jgi:hypothetical protein